MIQHIEEEQLVAAQQAHLENYLDLLEPRAQEQILRDFISGHSPKSRKLFAEVFPEAGEAVQLLLFSFSDPDHFSNLPALKRCIDNDTVLPGWKYSAILHDGVVLVFNGSVGPKVKEAVAEINKSATRSSLGGIRAAVSAKGTIEQLPAMYKNVAEAVRIFSPPSGTIPLIEAANAQYSKPVRQIIQYVKDNLSNSNLSLTYIATNVLFLNPDYLSKLFKKECGLKFSDYIMTLRMEKAKQLMDVNDELKMYEIARRVGLGDNAAYFGQVFRKYTGLLPSEYKQHHVK
jgi:AraC-like DNA-binding protein